MDFSQIEGLMGLASTALGMTGKAAETAQTIKGLLSSGKTPDNTEAARLISDLATQLTAANMTNVQLSEALRTVVSELRSHDDHERQLARYELFQTELGEIVYKLRDDMAEGQPIHFICPVCLNRDKQFIFIRGNGDIRACQAHPRDHLFAFRHTPRQTVARTRRGPSRF
ncbi:hypothetical protein N7379_02740 [Rhizobium pusense]|uniref:hypothetical protein n=1 Tax=Agrobacterium pusense TaxID=648995 RepID=UPI002448220F|nr:hypothetical protein [Agrobacterium pusense]MDH0113382.1 hypothetical protein [Agrobacterium pusense]